MKKWFASAMLVLVAMSGIAWSYAGQSARTTTGLHPEPQVSADAHRHFSGHTSHRGSMVLILE